MIILDFLLGFLIGYAASVLFMGTVLTVSAFLVDTRRLYDKDSRYYRFLLYYCSVFTYITARIRIETEGEELIPKEKPFLLIANHRSNFDPITSWVVLRHRTNITFISKPENFKIPLFGRIIRRCCFIPIDRENPRNAKATIDRAAELMKNDNCSIGVYPEGTRSKTGELLPFHNMVFRIAKQAQVPILVAVMENTEKIRKNFPLRSTKIKLKYIDLIPVETVMESKTLQLSQRVRDNMLKALNQTDTKGENPAA